MLKIGIAFVALALSGLSTPASVIAPTDRSEMALDLAVLSASSTLAADHTDNQALLVYAAGEAKAQAGFALSSEIVPAVSASADMGVSDQGAVQTGRSAAVIGAPPADPASRNISKATAGLATLNTLHGAAFDRLFYVIQRNALSNLEEHCRADRIPSGGRATDKVLGDRVGTTHARIESLGILK